ncbi:uncharacterized protein yc1106_08386 [Curvularia clavata]|uniref:AAA+ ATPase domain-containing protein n=1 Tax=Curvularia clavata TaxID=95742 RepID=A0A9Q9DVQ9_CURCL|nr:uncharacterized protein yc1106_08386 [Curvularia clavata]
MALDAPAVEVESRSAQTPPKGYQFPVASLSSPPGAPETSGSRFIRGRRYPSIPRLRPFHTGRPLAQASNPPPAPNGTPADQHGVNSADRDKEAAATAEEPADEAVALDDPDMLAQKLQRSRESSRRYSAALRRQQRGKKAQGLPPVHIPDWFLKKRVLRREDLPGSPQDAKPPAVLSVAVAHAESGEQAACALPARHDSDPTQVLSRLVRGLWSRRLDDNERHRVEKYLEERMAHEEHTDAATSQSRNAEAVASTEAGRPGDVPVAAITEDSAFTEAWAKLSKLQDDPDMDPRKKVEAMRKQSAKLEIAARKREVAKTRKMGTSRHLSSLVVAEIRATIAASLSALQPAASDSFPAAKTNLILHSPTPEHEAPIDACVVSCAFEMGSDVVVLSAQDLAHLAADYLGEGAEPSPRSIRSLGYETYRLNAEVNDFVADVQEPGTEEDTEWSPSASMGQSDPSSMRPRGIPLSIIALTPALRAMTQDLKGLQLGSVSPFGSSASASNDDPGRSQSQSEMQLEDLKLAALLEALIDSNHLKQSRGIIGSDSLYRVNAADNQQTSPKGPAFFDYSLGQSAELDLDSTLPAAARPDINLVVKVGQPSEPPNVPTKSKIIYVKDFKELNATHYGGRIIQKLEEIVRRRRIAGESVMIVGSTCSRDLTPELNIRYGLSSSSIEHRILSVYFRAKANSHSGVRGLQNEGESSFFRTIVVAPEPGSGSTSKLDEAIVSESSTAFSADISPAEKSKFRRINLYHIRDMLRSLDPSAAASISDMDQSRLRFREWAPIFSESHFDRVLTYDEVHRVALTALGLLVTSPSQNSASSGNTPSQLSWAHVALSMGLLKSSDVVKYMYFGNVFQMEKQSKSAVNHMEAKLEPDPARKRADEKALQRQRNLQQIALTANKHEKRLMPGIADPDQIKTTFDQVHVPTETVESIRTITSLSLLRPEAFSYGILATEKISGALLYGPPGTGKTLLAKAVAKESGSTVLEVSGSQIMDKYVGEGEKNVAAIFSLARKLSPCIVFLDEADAVFASRDAMRERASHRDILNQFLKEWDGLNDLSVFVMVATNRPFDLDDAVIRRLPRRLLVDLPTQADRKEILRIHLKGEQLDESVDLEDIAKRTPFYSGSDLKNIAVSAALACVKEENEQAALAAAKAAEQDAESESSQSEPSTDSAASTTSNPPRLVRGQTYKFPEKRILHARHFDKALQEISASISEDMSSLNAIKKFDEQYGDRKGNKRRKDFGFGMAMQRNENAARESPDAVDFVRVLLTALPQSLRQVAATNVPAVSRMLWEEFLDDNRPEWFRELPIDIQSYLINVFGPATAAPPESYTTPTDVPASVTSQPTETRTAIPTFGSLLTSAAAVSPTSRNPIFTAFPFPTRSSQSPSASSASASASSLSTSTSSLSSSSSSLYSSSQTPKSSSTTPTSTLVSSSAPPSNTPTDPVAPGPSDSGLTRNEKLAIGLGVPLGSLSIAALLFGCFLWWRRRKRQIEGSQPPSSPGFIPRFSFHIADADGYTERLNPGAQHGLGGGGDRNWDDTDEHEVGFDVDTAYHGIPPAATQMSMQDGHTPMIAPGLYHSHSSNRARGRQISVSSLHSVAEMREPEEEVGADSPVLGRYYQHKRGLAPRKNPGRTLVRGPGGFEGYAWSGDDVGRTVGNGAMPVPSRPAPVPLHAAPQYSGSGSSSSGLAGSSLSSQSPYAYVEEDYVPEYYYTGVAYDGPYEEAHIGRGY